MRARVRRANGDDAARLGRLRELAVEEASTRRGGPQLLEQLDDLEPELRTVLGGTVCAATVFVVELVDLHGSDATPPHPLGYAFVDLPDGTGAPARLRELFVVPETRTIGLGSALLDAALELAVQAGCSGLDATALPGDRATKNFFEDHGMVARAIVVHKRLLATPGDDGPQLDEPGTRGDGGS